MGKPLEQAVRQDSRAAAAAAAAAPRGSMGPAGGAALAAVPSELQQGLPMQGSREGRKGSSR